MVILVVGGGFLMLASFVLGVFVGMDMEKMPPFLSRELPSHLIGRIPYLNLREEKVASAPAPPLAESNASSVATTGGNASNNTGANGIKSDENHDVRQNATIEEKALPEKKGVLLCYGTFEQKRNADKLSARLKAHGFKSAQMQVNLQSKGVMTAVVSSKEFNNEKEAQRLAKKVVKKLKDIKPLVIPASAKNPTP